MLRLVLTAIVVGLALMLVASLVTASVTTVELMALGLLLIAHVAALFFLRAGRVNAAATCVIAVLLCAGVVGTVRYGSIRSLNNVYFVDAVVVASVFLGRRALIGTLLLTSALIGAVVYGEASGTITALHRPVGWVNWLVFSIALVLIGLLLHYAQTVAREAHEHLQQELTERKRAEEALRDSERHLKTMFDESPFGIARIDSVTGKILHVNPMFAKIAGRTVEQMATIDWMSITHPDDVQADLDNMARMNAGETTGFQMEKRCLRPGGDVVWIHMTIAALTSDETARRQHLAMIENITERRRAEEALRHAEERMEMFFSQSLDGFFFMMLDEPVTWNDTADKEQVLDYVFAHQRVTKVNDAMLAQYGATRERFIALTPNNFFAHDIAHGRRTWREFFDSGHLHLDTDERMFDGSTMWIEGDYTCLRDSEGRITGHFGIQRDITERKEAERTLLLLRASVDTASDALFWMVPDGRIVQVNDAACRSLGYTRDELLAMRVPDVDAHYDDDVWRAHFPALAAAGSLTFESEQRAKDGRLIPVEIVANYVRIGEEEFNCAFVRDITARRRVEAAHRLESAALQAVANAVVITDRAGVIVWANSAFTASTGFTTDEAIGRMPGALLTSGAHDAAFYRALWDTILADEVWRGEMTNRRKDGSRYLEEMTITPLKDERGEITHFIAVKLDITERKRLEEQFRQAQKMESVGLLAGGVAHDFNNMLGVILGTAELAIAQVDEAQPLHADLLEIRKAAVRSADLTRQLLAFARQQTIAPVVLDLNETVPGMLAMLQRLIGEDISLHWQPATALWPVLMDRSQMDQVLTNLCVNARHAIADVGTVAIATANVVADAAFCAQHAEAIPGDYVRLSVGDTGCGMDEATLARIFEPFFSTKGIGQGTGLGLATVYGAVKQNKGFLSVSSALGEGTTFEIYLPRHQGVSTPAPQTGPVAADHRGSETILLVEDEPALLRFVAYALEGQGYTVLAASSAADAQRLATVHAAEIHLLVSDVVMPEQNGRDLAHALLKLRPTLKSLFMSGYTADIIATRGLLAPGVAFIEKPFTPVALAAKVRKVLDGQ